VENVKEMVGLSAGALDRIPHGKWQVVSVQLMKPKLKI